MGMLGWLFGDSDNSNWALTRRLKRLENAFIELEGELVDIRSANMRLLGKQGAVTKQSNNKKLEQMNKDLVNSMLRQAGVNGKYETVAVLEPSGDSDGIVSSDRPEHGKGNNDK